MFDLWTLDVGSWMFVLGSSGLDLGPSKLIVPCILDIGYLACDLRSWAGDLGSWTFDLGPWILNLRL